MELMGGKAWRVALKSLGYRRTVDPVSHVELWLKPVSFSVFVFEPAKTELRQRYRSVAGKIETMDSHQWDVVGDWDVEECRYALMTAESTLHVVWPREKKRGAEEPGFGFIDVHEYLELL